MPAFTTRSRARAGAAQAAQGPSSPSGGWTLLELSFAGALLLVGLLAIVPLFVRTIRDVWRGEGQSKAAAWSQNRLERLIRPVSSTLAISEEYRPVGGGEWRPGAPDRAEEAGWRRRGEVRYLPLSAIEDGLVLDSELSETPPIEESDLTLALLEVTVDGVASGEIEAIVRRLERWTP